MNKRILLASALFTLALVLIPLAVASAVHARSQASVSPPAVGLTFNLAPGSSQTLPLAISNPDQRSLQWSATTNGIRWLTLDRKTGLIQAQEQQTIYATATTTAMPVGDYTATVTFTQHLTEITSTLVQLPVVMHVNAIPYGDNGPKAPTVSPSRLDLTNQQATSKRAWLTFSNPQANGQIQWSIGTGNVGWVQATPSTGSISAGGTQAVQVTVKTTGLPTGSYQTDLMLTFTQANSEHEPTSVLILVTLMVL